MLLLARPVAKSLPPHPMKPEKACNACAGCGARHVIALPGAHFRC